MTYYEQFISIIICTCSLFCIHVAASISDIPWRQYQILAVTINISNSSLFDKNKPKEDKGPLAIFTLTKIIVKFYQDYSFKKNQNIKFVQLLKTVKPVPDLNAWPTNC